MSAREFWTLAWLQWRLAVNAVKSGRNRGALEGCSRVAAALAPVLLALFVLPAMCGLAVVGLVGGWALAARPGALPAVVFTVGIVLLFPLGTALLQPFSTAPPGAHRARGAAAVVADPLLAVAPPRARQGACEPDFSHVRAGRAGSRTRRAPRRPTARRGGGACGRPRLSDAARVPRGLALARKPACAARPPARRVPGARLRARGLGAGDRGAERAPGAPAAPRWPASDPGRKPLAPGSSGSAGARGSATRAARASLVPARPGAGRRCPQGVRLHRPAARARRPDGRLTPGR